MVPREVQPWHGGKCLDQRNSWNCTFWSMMKTARISGLPIHPGVATVHTGDASSPERLGVLVMATGPFDIIMDDASHINSHQIQTLENLISSLNLGGFYVIEDIHSSRFSWEANIGSQEKGKPVGGTHGCMTMLKTQEPFPGVSHIDFHKEAVVFEKK